MSQLIERLREAHDNFAGLEGVSNDDLVAVLDAAAALTQPPIPAAAEGYVLVPVEPTPEMVSAFYQGFRTQLGIRHAARFKSQQSEAERRSAEEAGLRAMLSARPPIGETVPGAGEPHYPSLSEAYSTALEAAEVYYDAASEEETKWTGWGDQIVPFHAEMRRVKAKQALAALRDAERPAPPLASTQEGETP